MKINQWSRRMLVALLATLGLVTGGLSVASPAMAAGPYFWYAGANEGVATTKLYANMKVEQPTTTTGEHSLFELDVEKTVGGVGQRVEFGWNVDAALYAGCTPNPACLSEPHLFAYRKVGASGVYNTGAGSGWVDNGAVSVNLGDSIVGVVGTAKTFGIQYATGCGAVSGWWLAYNSQWIGCYPSTIWSGATPSVTTFTISDFVQAFGEVATPSNTTPCTDMGQGTQGSTGAAPASTISSVTYDAALPLASMSAVVTNASYYSQAWAGTSRRSFYLGGPGAC